MNLTDVGTIISGGASGLGAASAERLAEAGARITIFDVDAEAGKALARKLGGRFEKVDVTREGDVTTAIANAEKSHGVTRVLVNCAGIATGARTVDRNGDAHSLALFRKVVETNLIGTFNLLSKVAARMILADPLGEERGVFVNTASIAAFDGQIGNAAYSASKCGVVGLTLPVARDLAHWLIRVCTIAPGPFWTPMMTSWPAEALEALGRSVPHPSRLGRPEEFADLVAAIIGNPMLNGETIRLDGAIRMPPR